MRHQRPIAGRKVVVISTNKVKTIVYECPVCRMRLDGASCITDANPVQPQPRCLSVCVGCASILVYTETNLELATEDVIAAFPEAERATLESFVAFVKSTL